MSAGSQEGSPCGGDSEAEARGLRTSMREGFRLGEAVFQAEEMAGLKPPRLEGALFFGRRLGDPRCEWSL